MIYTRSHRDSGDGEQDQISDMIGFFRTEKKEMDQSCSSKTFVSMNRMCQNGAVEVHEVTV